MKRNLGSLPNILLKHEEIIMFKSFDAPTSSLNLYEIREVRLDNHVVFIPESDSAKIFLTKYELWGVLPFTVSWFADGHTVRLYEAGQPYASVMIDSCNFKLQILAGRESSICAPDFLQRLRSFSQVEDPSFLVYNPIVLPQNFWRILCDHIRYLKGY
jgi:hypothetical protein